ncbi:MAP9 protein, partial [Hemiprocne comata]|nr:MAP9 protein [Hemiprocne comata]
DELQEAVSAHAAREQTAEYSDDFESDEDGILNGTGEELNGVESAKKSVVEDTLSDDDNSQKAADLENEAADDLTLSIHEKKPQQIMLLESGIIQDDRKDGEEEHLENPNEGVDRKNNEECSAAEEVPCDNTERDHCNNLPVGKLQKKINQEENKPTPKPRVHKTRNASASGEKEVTFCLSPHCRIFQLFPCVSHTPEKHKRSSFCYPSFHTDFISSWLDVRRALAVVAMALSFGFCTRTNASGKFGLYQEISTSDLKLEDSSIKSSSVMEVSMTIVYEKTKKPDKSTDDSSNEVVKIVEVQIVTETIQEIVNKFVSWYFYRSLSSMHLKKKAKAGPSATSVSSQYLGTLKVLEDKRMPKSSTEFEKADSLRAAVFQGWLEKKRVFLMELKRAEKKKAENLRNNAEKKEAVKREEAIASFEAWKKKKGREAKTLSEKKKLEELQKKKAAEQNEEKTEAAQKAFEKWKERKVEYLREQSRKEKQSERIRKKKEEELVAEKKKDSMSAVEKWNEKKKEYIKQKKVEKTLERRKQEIQQAEKEEKNKKALEEYEKWL